MPSSTSSFERHIPAGRWGITFALAVALAIVALWRIEVATRASGQRPSVVDDPFLWSLSRRQVDSDPRLVVLMGASRMAIDYSPTVMREAAPHTRVIQLSISDHLPLAVLADLAADPAFHGIAVVDLIESEMASPLLMTAAHEYIDRSHTLWRAPGALINRYFASVAQSQLAELALGGRRLIMGLVAKRALPAPAWVAIDRDRTSHADYSLSPPGALLSKAGRRLENLAPAPSPAEWLAKLDVELEPLVRAIEARGGHVVVVRLPISGRLAAAIDERYPRATYWDAFAARTHATTIQARDLPETAALVCPDEMHLDGKDQPVFTRALAGALRARKLIG
ncbi:hypothetical protein BH11MYX2_BH11MYX2_32240 [soil metagenome]